MKPGKILGIDRPGRIRVEDFEEVPEALALGLDAELLYSSRAIAIAIHIVVEGDAVEPEIRAAVAFARAGNRDGRTGCDRASPCETASDGAAAILAAADDVDVGRVVGPAAGRDMAVVEEAFLDREQLVGVADMSMMSTSPAGRSARSGRDIPPACGYATSPPCASGDLPGAAMPKRHVGVLGVGEDEILRARGVGVDAGEFLVERLVHWILVKE